MLRVEGVNITSAYGIHVEKGGIEEYLSTAPLRKPVEVDWWERDGVVVDLEQPKLEAWEFSLNLIYLGRNKAVAFLSWIINLHTFTLNHSSGIERVVRLVGITRDETLVHDKGRITLRLEELEPKVPSGAVAVPRSETAGEPIVNGKPLSAFGFVLLEGRDKLGERGNIKEGLRIKTSDKAGVTYAKPTNGSRKKKRDIVLELFTEGEGAIGNYQALVAELLRPNLQEIDGHKCYYNVAKVNKYEPNGWLIVELKLTEVYDSNS